MFHFLLLSFPGHFEEDTSQGTKSVVESRDRPIEACCKKRAQFSCRCQEA